jgi:hypothetical protein
MISKCANPGCNTTFRKLSDGKLFGFELKQPSPPCKDVPNSICEQEPERATVHFWLCGRCAGAMTLSFNPRDGVTVLPLPRL